MLYNLFENRDFVSVFAVALLAEGVDRNDSVLLPELREIEVALLAEGVDRNCAHDAIVPLKDVALLAEGVDRNADGEDLGRDLLRSPSSRRAWIEICQDCAQQESNPVALLAEGVDRNNEEWYREMPIYRSPSSRRAWIEIDGTTGKVSPTGRRPPRGGRG